MISTTLTANLRQLPERETLVSVVVPTYNRAHLLPDAIDSVLRQKWPDVEVVVVDDGSSDNTADIVAALARSDSRVRYLAQENRGVSSARNKALANCRGSMIAFLDSDDVWHSSKLEIQVGILQSLPRVGMVWSDMHAIDADGRHLCHNYLRKMYKGYDRLSQDELFSSSTRLVDMLAKGNDAPLNVTVFWGRIYPKMVFGNLVHTSTVLMRRERAADVGPFDESMRAGGEDYKYHLATTRLGEVAFVDTATIDYRIGGDDQITNIRNQVNFATSFLSTLEEQIEHYPAELQLSDRELNAIRADAHDWLASALIERGQRRRAAVHALKAIHQRPVTPTAWKTLAKTMLPRTAVDLVRAARKLRTGSTAASM